MFKWLFKKKIELTDDEKRWQDCCDGKVMLKAIAKTVGDSDSASRKKLVRVVAECVRKGLGNIRSFHPRIALETAEAWAAGNRDITLSHVKYAGRESHESGRCTNVNDEHHATDNLCHLAWGENTTDKTSIGITFYLSQSLHHASGGFNSLLFAKIARKYYPVSEGNIPRIFLSLAEEIVSERVV